MKTRTQHALEFIALALVFALAAGVGDVLADGKVTTPPPAVATWHIEDMRFARIATDNPVAVMLVGWRRDDGSLDKVEEHSFSGAQYPQLLGQIVTPCSATAPCGTYTDESTITVTKTTCTTDAAGIETCTDTVSPDLSRIFRLRISRFIVGAGALSSDEVTTEPVYLTTTSVQ